MSMLEWALLGALLLGIIIFSARVMRKGITTLDEDRQRYMEKIHEEEKHIAEERKNISASDHLWIMQAALEDLLRLDGNPEGFSVHRHGMIIDLVTPKGPWRIELSMRERSLKSSHRVLHGKSRWILSGFDILEQHLDPASLMASLNSHIRSEPIIMEEPEHLARRLHGLRSPARRLS